jgi:hypothetical protein
MSVASILQKSIRTILDEGPRVAVEMAARRVRFIFD